MFIISLTDTQTYIKKLFVVCYALQVLTINGHLQVTYKSAKYI
jgi:hypothetical protein